MKAVLISIQPKWCELIATGRKTVEVRKTEPNIETPFKCYIYQTRHGWIYKLLKKLGLYRGKVVGEFICDSIRKGRADHLVQAYYHNSPTETCLTDQELVFYANHGKPIYFWHISELKMYDEPKELSEFYKIGKREACVNGQKTCLYARITDFCKSCEFAIKTPPQSWCYVETL